MAEMSDEDIINALNFLGKPAETRLRGPVGFPYAGAAPLGGFPQLLQQFGGTASLPLAQGQQPPKLQDKPPQKVGPPQQPGQPPKVGTPPSGPQTPQLGGIPQPPPPTPAKPVVPSPAPAKPTAPTPVSTPARPQATPPPAPQVPVSKPQAPAPRPQAAPPAPTQTATPGPVQLPGVPIPSQKGGGSGGFSLPGIAGDVSKIYGAGEIGSLLGTLITAGEGFGGPIGAAIGAITAGITSLFGGGPGRIHLQKEQIQDLYTPIFQHAASLGYPLRDNHALDFKSEGVQRQLAANPQLANMASEMLQQAPILGQKAFGSTDPGLDQRLVNQFLANAAINQWTPAQTAALWASIIRSAQAGQAPPPAPTPPPVQALPPPAPAPVDDTPVDITAGEGGIA